MTRTNPSMLQRQDEVPVETNHEIVDDYVYLVGRPTLGQFLSFVKNRSLNGRRADVGALTDEWRTAASHICELEKSEADLAQHPGIQPLPPRLEALQEPFLRDPLVQHGFNTVPTQLGVVELDRLVVYQHHIDLSYVNLLKAKLGSAPGEEEIFRLCLPAGQPKPPVRWARAKRPRPSNGCAFCSHKACLANRS